MIFRTLLISTFIFCVPVYAVKQPTALQQYNEIIESTPKDKKAHVVPTRAEKFQKKITEIHLLKKNLRSTTNKLDIIQRRRIAHAAHVKRESDPYLKNLIALEIAAGDDVSRALGAIMNEQNALAYRLQCAEDRLREIRQLLQDIRARQEGRDKITHAMIAPPLKRKSTMRLIPFANLNAKPRQLNFNDN